MLVYNYFLITKKFTFLWYIFLTISHSRKIQLERIEDFYALIDENYIF